MNIDDGSKTEEGKREEREREGEKEKNKNGPRTFIWPTPSSSKPNTSPSPMPALPLHPHLPLPVSLRRPLTYSGNPNPQVFLHGGVHHMKLRGQKTSGGEGIAMGMGTEEM